jgi:N-acetylmuramoyl-L-alanine amidase
VIVLDPGHGGIDPGAQAGDVTEAQLMLTFAFELKEAILRTGSFDVALTRDADIFVPLETRITIARQAGASVFLSLHADALAEGSGSASGATVYTLSDAATDEASLALAERHNRDDLLSGVDLSEQGDEIALILMDLARTETVPRTARLAETVVEGFREAGVKVNSRPLRSAAFSVLKSPDFPSLLVEIGFLSSPRDVERLIDPEWRAKAAQGIAAALVDWAAEDAAQSHLLRQ